MSGRMWIGAAAAVLAVAGTAGPAAAQGRGGVSVRVGPGVGVNVYRGPGGVGGYRGYGYGGLVGPGLAFAPGGRYGYPYGYGYGRPGVSVGVQVGSGLGVVGPSYYRQYGYGGYASGSTYSVVPYAYAQQQQQPLYYNGGAAAPNVYVPSTPPPEPPQAEQIPAPQPSATTAAQLTVRVPANARLWVENHPTTQTGTERQFVTPTGLTPGQVYTYTFRADWEENGRTVSQTRTIEFSPGTQVIVDFTQPPPRI